ncbi:urease accessory protein UreE [Vibrio astriarenae]|nr:urease accessory protein UreE [Vibrio sp. C7]
MIELTEINAHGDKPADEYLSLPIDSRIKSRLKVTLDDGRDAGLFLPRGHILRGGEQLKSQCGLVVEVKAALEQVSTVYCDDAHLLTRVAYHLAIAMCHCR